MQEVVWNLDKPRQMAIDYLTQKSISFLDLKPILTSISQNSDELLYYKYDGHFSPAGHQAVSQALYNYLNK